MNIFDAYNTERRALLSKLWVFVLVSILLHDLQGALNLNTLQEADGSSISTSSAPLYWLLTGSLLLQLQLAMIVLTRLLPTRINAWANFLMVAVTIFLLASQAKFELKDQLFVIFQLTALCAIIWFACLQRKFDQFALLLAPTVR